MNWLKKIIPASREITEEKIFLNLERKRRKYGFAHPMFTDENFAYGKARLTVFRSEAEWIIAFEYLVYIGEADVFENIVECYGNKIKKPYYINNELFQLITYDDDESADSLNFEIIINSNKRHFRFSSEDYRRNGIDLKKPISGNALFDTRLQILRMLVNYLPPEDIFFSTSNLLNLVGRPSTLPVFLQLYEWHHPDGQYTKNEFLTPCLQSLIKAIAKNDARFYECDTKLINTHWSSWPLFGMK
jgi:hypothetical protein